MKLGLVLDGGGGKGAYQIGVWKAMREFGLDKLVTAVSGTSVGGLNAALFVQGDFDLAYHIWTEEISRIHIPSLQMDLSGLIDEYIDFQAVRESKIDCFLSAHSDTQSGEYSEPTLDGKSVERYVNGKMVYYNLRVLSERECRIAFERCSTSKAVLLATSAIPILCPQVWIKKHYYKDGGCGDNCPVYPLSWKESDCDTIIAIHLDALKTAEKENYPGVRILEIVPNAPSHEMGLWNGTLNFTLEHARSLLEKGYRDGKGIFKKMIQNALLAHEEKVIHNWKKAIEEKQGRLPAELRSYYEQIVGTPYMRIDRKED